MSDLAQTDRLFFDMTGMDRRRVEGVVGDALGDADDGELFLEYCQSESFGFDDGRLKSASFDTTQGFGLRAIMGEATGFAHATELSEDAIKRAASTVRAVRTGYHGTMNVGPAPTRCPRCRSRPRSSCWPTSTPMPGPRTRGSARS